MSDTQGSCYHRRTVGRYGHLKCEDCGAISDPSTGYKWSPFPGTVSVASDDVQQRAAEVIELNRSRMLAGTVMQASSHSIARALAAANLLADPDTARLRRLGEAVEKLREILGELWLYVDWGYCTKQLTTEQKELWADCVDEWTSNEPPVADRWWREAGVEQ